MMTMKDCELDITRVYSLCKLVNLCKEKDIKVTKVVFYMNGFKVVFEDWGGDAILHDGSYENTKYKWETIGFPWDGEDVSTHTAEELVSLLYLYKFAQEQDLDIVPVSHIREDM